MTTILIIAIAWYIIGVIGGLIASRWDSYMGGGITLFDILISITYGGLGGIITFAIGVIEYYNNCPDSFLRKKMF